MFIPAFTYLCWKASSRTIAFTTGFISFCNRYSIASMRLASATRRTSEKRFIAYFVGRRLGRGYNHPLCLSSVSSTNDCRFRFVAYDFENVFHVRGLARASDGQISHANNRNGEFLRFYYAPVKHKIAHTCCRTVNPRHGNEQVAYVFSGNVHCEPYLMTGVNGISACTLSRLSMFFKSETAG